MYIKDLWHGTRHIIFYLGKRSFHLFFPPIIHCLIDKYCYRRHHLLIDTVYSFIAFVLVIINIGLGFWFYTYLTPARLQLNIIVPEKITSGEEITYILNYANQTKDIKNLKFKFIYPRGFAKEENEFYIGNLVKGQSGELRMEGDLLSNVGVEEKIEVFAEYLYYDRPYTERAFKTYKIESSNFTAAVELPEKILIGEEFDLKIKYKNNSPLKRENIHLKLKKPANLKTAIDEIVLVEVGSYEEGEKTIKGTFTETGEMNVLIQVIPFIGEFKQVGAENYMNVLSPRLEIEAKVSPTIADLGNTLTYTITYKNIGDAELRHIEIIAGEKTFIGEDLKPGESKEIIYQEATGASIRQENYMITKEFSATAQIEDLNVRTYSPSVTTEVKFNSPLVLSLDAKYYGPDNEQLGYGPWPLQAGEVTALRVFLNISDFTNDLENVVLKTSLPSQGEWTGLTSVSAGTNLEYNSQTREITWEIGEIYAFGNPVGASFEVRVLPNSTQIGQKINVINDTSITAQDSFTGSLLQSFYGPLRPSTVGFLTIIY